MTREDTLLDLFLHPGWKLVIDDMREAYGVLVKTTHHLKTEQELYLRKGQIQKMAEMLAFEEVTKLQITEDNAEII